MLARLVPVRSFLAVPPKSLLALSVPKPGYPAFAWSQAQGTEWIFARL